MYKSRFRIETERLILKPITIVYAEEIFHEFTDEITKFMYASPSKNIDKTILYVRNSIEGNRSGTDIQLVILNKITNEFLGCVAIHKINTNTPNIGVWLKKSAHGNGVGKESVFALKNWSDNNLI